MPETWTAEKDQKLLLYALEAGMINVPRLAALWSEKEPNGVTAGAVSQHLTKLRNKVGVKSNGKATSSSTPSSSKIATPRAKATPKTPNSTKSTGKRKKVNMSDEDDSEEEVRDSASPLGKREMSRRSKTPKLYAELAGEGEDADDEEAGEVKQESSKDAMAAAAGQDHGMDIDAMSEVSAFNPDDDAFL